MLILKAYYAAMDLFLALIPITFLASLQLPRVKKIILMMVMSLGVW